VETMCESPTKPYVVINMAIVDKIERPEAKQAYRVFLDKMITLCQKKGYPRLVNFLLEGHEAYC
jgi:hypothetical protein